MLFQKRAQRLPLLAVVLVSIVFPWLPRVSSSIILLWVSSVVLVSWFLSVSCPDLPFSHLSCVHLRLFLRLSYNPRSCCLGEQVPKDKQFRPLLRKKRCDGRHTSSPRRPVECRTEGIKEGEECPAGSRESHVQVLGELRPGEKCTGFINSEIRIRGCTN